MANAKQDGVHPRTAADIERRYNFDKSFAEVMGIAEDARDVAAEAKEAVGKLDSNLTADEIFNRLTNNGAIQGLFKGEDGQVYINAKYIKAIEELFANDITMSGKLTYSTEAYLPPTEKETEMIGNHIVGNITIPDELIPLYDANGDGKISISDQAAVSLIRLGLLTADKWNGIKKTPVTLTIDLANPDKFICIKGTNMWGTEIESYIGVNFTNIKNPEVEQRLDAIQDYIIEQGTSYDGSGVEWNYRKWNSGIAECWFKKSFTYTTSGTYNYQNFDNAISFPSGMFIAAPNIQFTPMGANLVKLSCHGLTASGCSLFIETAYAASATVQVQIFCIGKWK